MKNLSLTPYLLPTDGESFLEMNDVLSVCQFDNMPLKSHIGKNQHLHLVSDSPIKEEDWILWNKKLVKAINTSYTAGTKKIIFTTDPKLIADGVLPIDGNTRAIVECKPVNPQAESTNIRGMVEVEAPFLTNFCKRWNENKSSTIGYGKWKDSGKVKDTKKVDARVYDIMVNNGLTIDSYDKESLEDIENALNQALQSTGQYSLEQARIIFANGGVAAMRNYLGKNISLEMEFNDTIQYLQPQYKGEIDMGLNVVLDNKKDNDFDIFTKIKAEMVVEVEMEEAESDAGGMIRMKERIKLDSNGQPTLILK